MDPMRGLLNGTWLMVKELHANFINADIITGSNNDEHIFIPWINLKTKKKVTILHYEMLPIPFDLCLCNNSTSQGQQIDHDHVYVFRPVSGHGQLHCSANKRTESLECEGLCKI